MRSVCPLVQSNELQHGRPGLSYVGTNFFGVCHVESWSWAEPLVRFDNDDDAVDVSVKTSLSALSHLRYRPPTGIQWERRRCRHALVSGSDITIQALARMSKAFLSHGKSKMLFFSDHFVVEKARGRAIKGIGD